MTTATLDAPVVPFTVTGHNERVAHRPSIGQLVWFSVADVYVPQAELAERLRQADLEAFIPGLPAPADVFRKVTKSAEQTFNHDDGTKTKVIVRDLSTDSEKVVRRVVAEHVDGKGQRLSYRQVWELTFSKDHDSISIRPIEEHAGMVMTRDRATSPDLTDDFIPGLRDLYAERLTAINADGIRSLIKRVALGSHGVSVRDNGALFFVPVGHTDAIADLQQVVRPIRGTAVHACTITDEDDGTTDLVFESIVNATSDAAEAMIAEFETATDAGKTISKRALRGMSEKYDALRDRLGTYQDLLRSGLTEAAAQLIVLDGLMTQAMIGGAA